jgi:hypothetical protein
MPTKPHPGLQAPTSSSILIQHTKKEDNIFRMGFGKTVEIFINI